MAASSTSPSTSMIQPSSSSSSSHVSSGSRKQDRPAQYNHQGVFNLNHHQNQNHNQNSGNRDTRGGIENRPTRMILQVCYELNALLNPPALSSTLRHMPERTSPSSKIVASSSSSSSSSSTHPASLSPLHASQDTILKILTTLCTVLRSDGSALVLCDTPPVTPSAANNANYAGRECVIPHYL